MRAFIPLIILNEIRGLIVVALYLWAHGGHLL